MTLADRTARKRRTACRKARAEGYQWLLHARQYHRNRPEALTLLREARGAYARAAYLVRISCPDPRARVIPRARARTSAGPDRTL